MWGEHKCYAAFLYDELEEYENEIARLSQILKSSNDDYIALNNRGMLFWEIGQDKKAFEDLKRACELSYKDPLPHSNLARFFMAQEQTEQAVILYRKAVQIDPKNSSSQISLADVLLSQENYRESIDHFTMAISASEDIAYFYAQRAKAFDGLKNKLKAKLDRESANRLDPKRFPKKFGFFRF